MLKGRKRKRKDALTVQKPEALPEITQQQLWTRQCNAVLVMMPQELVKTILGYFTFSHFTTPNGTPFSTLGLHQSAIVTSTLQDCTRYDIQLNHWNPDGKTRFMIGIVPYVNDGVTFWIPPSGLHGTFTGFYGIHKYHELQSAPISGAVLLDEQHQSSNSMGVSSFFQSLRSGDVITVKVGPARQADDDFELSLDEYWNTFFTPGQRQFYEMNGDKIDRRHCRIGSGADIDRKSYNSDQYSIVTFKINDRLIGHGTLYSQFTKRRIPNHELGIHRLYCSLFRDPNGENCNSSDTLTLLPT